MHITDYPSPNYGARREGPVDILLLHYTATAEAETALRWLTQAGPAGRVSSHYLIDIDGTCYKLVAEERRAWHAGRSFWSGSRDINSRSIGIEIVNDGSQAYPDAQIDAVIALGRDIVQRYLMPAWRVLGHSDVSPDRKIDPGGHFPWQRLAAAGLGLWPDPMEGPDWTTEEVQKHLAQIGYGLSVDGLIGPETRSVISAFQRHYRPQGIDGEADAETQALIRGLHHAVFHPDTGRLLS